MLPPCFHVQLAVACLAAVAVAAAAEDMSERSQLTSGAAHSIAAAFAAGLTGSIAGALLLRRLSPESPPPQREGGKSGEGTGAKCPFGFAAEAAVPAASSGAPEPASGAASAADSDAASADGEPSKCPFGFSADSPPASPPADAMSEGDATSPVARSGLMTDRAMRCPMFGSMLATAGAGTVAPPGLTADGAPRTILLTGASRGIGHGTVKMFAAAGWRVITCSRTSFPSASPKSGSSKCPWTSGTVNHVTVDLADAEDTKRAIKEIRTKLRGQPLHALVNNAAISPKLGKGGRMGVKDTSLETWQSVFQVNFYACFMLVNGLLDDLKAAVPHGGGSVVNVTSIVGSRVHPFAGPAYATSKAALSALTREMAAEFGGCGLRVNSISPGEIDTSILSPGTQEIVDNEIPMRRLGTVSEVAHAIYFLVSEQSAYVNGTELHINGGQHC